MDWRDLGGALLKEGLPLLASAIPGAGLIAGPVAGLIANALGLDSPDPDKIASALKSNPDALLKLKQLEADHQVELQKLALAKAQQEAQAADQAERNVTDRSAKYEGTAADLLQAGLPGRILLFLRSSIRPLFAYGVGYVDFQVFSKHWPIQPQSEESVTFLVANALVLGFWFGERFLQNVLPIVLDWMAKRQAGKPG